MPDRIREGKNMKTKLIVTLLIATLGACSLAGGKSDDTSSKNMLYAVILANTATTINFGLDSGTLKNVSCTGYVSSDTVKVSGGTQVSLKDARFYVYDVKLIKTDGTKSAFSLSSTGVFQNSYTANGNSYSVGLLDFADGTSNCSSGLYGTSITSTTNTKLTGGPVVGLFSGIEFTVGVPEDLNHQDDTTLAAPLNSAGMYWSWNGGYKFMKLELLNGSSSSNAWHIGSSSCTNSVCTYYNRATITVTKSSGTFNPSTDTVALDLQALMNGTDTTTTALSCMSGPQSTDTKCGTIGTNMGVTKATGLSSGIQTAFTIR